MSELESLAEHHGWANQVLVQCIHAHGWSERPARLISHLVLAEDVWHGRISGAPIDREVFRILARFEVDERSAHHRQRFRSMLRGSLDDRIAYRRFSGAAHESTVREILLHVITHGCHHRGQITSHLTRQGIAPPAIDFLTYSGTVGR